MRVAVLVAVLTAGLASAQTYSISTFAGGAVPLNVPATSVSLIPFLTHVAVDKSRNVYFTEANAVLRLDAVTGLITLVAGNWTDGFSGDNGPATSAQLRNCNGLALDAAGNLYIADTGNNRVRKVSAGIITTVAGNGSPGFGGDNRAAVDAQLSPVGIALDTAGNLYIADPTNQRIRKLTSGVIITVAGSGVAGYGGDNGPASAALLNYPEDVSVDAAGTLYIADYANNRVRSVSAGVIRTVAGNGVEGPGGDSGPATSAQLHHPSGVAVDPSTGALFIADPGNARVRRVQNGIISTVAGGGGVAPVPADNGPATNASLNLVYPDIINVALDSAGNLYIPDVRNSRLRKVTSGIITTVAGNGLFGYSGDGASALSAQMWFPEGVAFDAFGNLYIADNLNDRVRKVSTSGVITTVAGNGARGYSGDNGPAPAAMINRPYAVAFDSAGNMFIAEGNHIRKVSNGIITTVAGTTFGFSGDNGPATAAQIGFAEGIAVDGAGNIYIADTTNNRIRKVSGGIITTIAGNGTPGFAGDGGPAASAQLCVPRGLTIDPAGNLYFADACNARVRKISNGVITTVAGNGAGGFGGDGGPATSAAVSPTGVAIGPGGDLFISDGNRIRKVSAGIITTIAGGGPNSAFTDNSPAASAQLFGPVGLTVTAKGSVYFAEPGSGRVRVLNIDLPSVNPGGIVPLYSALSVIQPGSWISIFGRSFADGNYAWSGDFPTSLGGVSVSINHKLAYIWSVSPTQINLQAPDDTATGPVDVVVVTKYGVAYSAIVLAPYGPSFSLLGDGRHAAGVIATPNGSGAYGGGAYDLAGPFGAFTFRTRPVKSGETLTLYGVGFGPTTPTVPAGQIFSGAAPTQNPVTIFIGGAQAKVAFSGITQSGLYQFNITVPDIPSGDQPLLATVNGIPTPPGVVIAVQ